MDLNSHVSELLTEFKTENQKEEDMRRWIEQLPEDQLLETLKKINPYSVTLPVHEGESESVSISYTNMRLEFMKRLVTTSMIGFLMRSLKEYKVPDEVPPVEIADYVADPAVAATPDTITDARLKAKYEEYRENMPERIAIWEFLKNIFEFDPDRHVAAALQTNTADPERKTPDTESTRRAVAAKRNAIREADARQDYEIQNADDLKKRAEADATSQSGVATSEIAKEAFAMVPPLDTFARYDLYLESHYDEFIDCTKRLYGIQPDVELCLIVYDKHDNKEEAKKFKDKYIDQVIAPITNIAKNRWVALGPYRQNRERVDFFNRHTEILKEMLDQRERDSHIATDIMKKRIKKKKAENVSEAGPDDREFRRYLKANKPAIARMGGEHVTDMKEEDDDECPKDAVEVNVFTLGDGGREMKVHKIYNPVEQPLSKST